MTNYKLEDFKQLLNEEVSRTNIISSSILKNITQGIFWKKGELNEESLQYWESDWGNFEYTKLIREWMSELNQRERERERERESNPEAKLDLVKQKLTKWTKIIKQTLKK